eukprot:c35038_g1_i1 orf=1-330(+)
MDLRPSSPHMKTRENQFFKQTSAETCVLFPIYSTSSGRYRTKVQLRLKHRRMRPYRNGIRGLSRGNTHFSSVPITITLPPTAREEKETFLLSRAKHSTTTLEMRQREPD